MDESALYEVTGVIFSCGTIGEDEAEFQHHETTGVLTVFRIDEGNFVAMIDSSSRAMVQESLYQYDRWVPEVAFVLQIETVETIGIGCTEISAGGRLFVLLL